MNGGGIKNRDRAFRGGDQQPDLRAAEDNALCPLLRQPRYHLQIIVAGGVAEGAEAELFKNDPVDALPLLGIGNKRVNGKPLFTAASSLSRR